MANLTIKGIAELLVDKQKLSDGVITLRSVEFNYCVKHKEG